MELMLLNCFHAHSARKEDLFLSRQQQNMTKVGKAIFNELSDEPATVEEMAQDTYVTALSISQAAVAKMEKSQKPQKATLKKLAALYDCRATQLLLD